MQVSDVRLIGHFNTSNKIAETFVNETKWINFCKDNFGLLQAAIPKIDFSKKKVILIPSFHPKKSSYLSYKESCRKYLDNKMIIELNLTEFLPDTLSKRVFHSSSMVLELPRYEDFEVFIDPCTKDLNSYHPTEVELLTKREKNEDSIAKVANAQKTILDLWKFEEPKLVAVRAELEATKRELEATPAVDLKIYYLGKLLNPKSPVTSK